ncbi:transglutaminase-like domain-containing protein [Stieleria varia]|uniref:Transglutaminase-like superfamily protein n=1 Tax=Stieleria varia TaxID=2528005 RepID=A0A5C6AEI4_9BACT|nr:transglutaminase domain-containing protein [Stieleria varia]TWT98452.1 Transglutaminase-like superfamily protein [Stieleria varia]
MPKPLSTLFAIALVLSIITPARCDPPTESIFSGLPPGVFVSRSLAIPTDQAKMIGEKFGGNVNRLSNTVLRVHGRTIQVNAFTAVTAADADAIHSALLKLKPYPYCVKKGTTVVEYVGQDADEALALKTSYELGLLPKPNQVRYRVTAQLALIEKADYMACNPLFQEFASVATEDDENAAAEIGELAQQFTFGNSLKLRKPASNPVASDYLFEPESSGATAGGSSVHYTFPEPPQRYGVPYVTTAMDVTVGMTGLTQQREPPGREMTAATTFWPADEPQIVELAKQITAGRDSNGAKAMAILQWLAPGRNLKYSGQTGSRWGTLQVLNQRFGHCWDFSDCFVTLARAAGVPSRQIGGWFYGSAGHIWAEFYREETGWQQVDPTGGGQLRCGIYHIPYFTTDTGDMPIVYLAEPRIEVIDAR